MKSDMKIYRTMDVEQFKKLSGNRDVRGVEKIIQSINKVGYVLSPILVNENMEVIDGQNRLEACKELGLPVYYIVQDGLGLEECRALNIGQSNWNTEDYIRSYASNGNESYQRLLSLWTEYKKIFGGEVVIMACDASLITESGGGSKSKLLKEGKFTLTEERSKRARTILKSMIDLGFVDFAKERELRAYSFYGAVIYAYMHNEVNAKELIERMRQNPLAMISCSRIVDQLTYFDEIWNKGRKRNYKKVFMSADYQRRLYLEEV